MNYKVYSANGEDNWTEDLDLVLDEVGEGHKAGDTVEVYVGDSEPYSHSDFVNGDSIIGGICDIGGEEMGEWCEDYLYDFDQKKVKELEDIIIKFLSENARPPIAYRVINIKTEKHILD